MNPHRTVKEYRQEKSVHGKPWFLAKYNLPVLVTANPESTAGAGYLTLPKTSQITAGASYAAKLGFIPDERYIVIPVVKAEGRPFPERIGVGRTRGTDIALAGTDISKYHAYFTGEGERWQLADAKSSNGTFVDGVRLQPMNQVQLNSGAVLAFGARLHLFLTPRGFCDFI